MMLEAALFCFLVSKSQRKNDLRVAKKRKPYGVVVKDDPKHRKMSLPQDSLSNVTDEEAGLRRDITTGISLMGTDDSITDPIKAKAVISAKASIREDRTNPKDTNVPIDHTPLDSRDQADPKKAKVVIPPKAPTTEEPTCHRVSKPVFPVGESHPVSQASKPGSLAASLSVQGNSPRTNPSVKHPSDTVKIRPRLHSLEDSDGTTTANLHHASSGGIALFQTVNTDNKGKDAKAVSFRDSSTSLSLLATKTVEPEDIQRRNSQPSWSSVSLKIKSSSLATTLGLDSSPNVRHIEGKQVTADVPEGDKKLPQVSSRVIPRPTRKQHIRFLDPALCHFMTKGTDLSSEANSSTVSQNKQNNHSFLRSDASSVMDVGESDKLPPSKLLLSPSRGDTADVLDHHIERHEGELVAAGGAVQDDESNKRNIRCEDDYSTPVRSPGK